MSIGEKTETLLVRERPLTLQRMVGLTFEHPANATARAKTLSGLRSAVV